MYSIDQIKTALQAIADQLQAEAPLLAELDGLSGDGDLGITAAKLSEALRSASGNDQQDLGPFFMKMGMEMNKQAPSTMGTLLAAAVMAQGKRLKGKTGLTEEELADIPAQMADEIMKKGKAQPGDKTILDALLPMAEAVETTYASTGNIREAYRAGAQAASEGAENTRGMLAKTGRASWIADRTKENLDGGAVLCAKIAEIWK